MNRTRVRVLVSSPTSSSAAATATAISSATNTIHLLLPVMARRDYGYSSISTTEE
jgi:hypothetical protein